jgi:hypothetical protein
LIWGDRARKREKERKKGSEREKRKGFSGRRWPIRTIKNTFAQLFSRFFFHPIVTTTAVFRSEKFEMFRNSPPRAKDVKKVRPKLDFLAGNKRKMEEEESV